MASRKEQKEQAREQRLAREHQQQAVDQRRQRLQIIGGIIAVAVVVVVVLIVVSSGGGNKPTTAKANTPANKAAVKRVSTLLTGLNQAPGSSIELGDPNAKVTITEFGDLECSICDEFDLAAGVKSPDAQEEGYQGLGILDSLIEKDVRTGKAKLVYKSLETATSSGGSPSMWKTQQAAANAAALQGKGWDYVELFYNEQGYEKADYVTDAFLEGLAKQVKGLDYAKWYKDWKSDPATKSVLKSQESQGTQLDVLNETNMPADERGPSTPTIWVKGPNNQATFIGIQKQTAAAEIALIQKAINASA